MNNQNWTARGEHLDALASRLLKDRQSAILFIVVFVLALLLTSLLVVVGLKSSFRVVLGVGVALLIALLVIYRPKIGLFLVVVCTVLIEQDPLSIHILTDRLSVYYWPPSLAGFADRLIGFLFLLSTPA